MRKGGFPRSGDGKERGDMDLQKEEQQATKSVSALHFYPSHPKGIRTDISVGCS